MHRKAKSTEELLRRANRAQLKATVMGNPIEMSLEDRYFRRKLLANAEYFRMQARRYQHT